MNKSGTSSAMSRIQEGFRNFKKAMAKCDSVIDKIEMIFFHLRKLVMAAPVVYYALKLYAYNKKHLPEQVGINLQATGEFTKFIGRNMALLGPLVLTFGCLFCMICSRKATYAWAISILTLILPILLLVSNLYPA